MKRKRKNERSTPSLGLAAAGTKVSKVDHARLLKVRRGLRALALVHHGKTVKEEVFQDLDKAASSAKLVIRFTDSGEGRVESAEGGSNGALAEEVAEHGLEDEVGWAAPGKRASWSDLDSSLI